MKKTLQLLLILQVVVLINIFVPMAQGQSLIYPPQESMPYGFMGADWVYPTPQNFKALVDSTQQQLKVMLK